MDRIKSDLIVAFGTTVCVFMITQSISAEIDKGDAKSMKETMPVQPALAHLSESATRLAGGILMECCEKNRTNLFEKIDVDGLCKVYQSEHDSWYAEPEFCGKYLDTACVFYRQTGNQEYLARAKKLVEAILAGQRADGYLGTYKGGQEFETFGMWNTFFTMRGLLSFYEISKDDQVLAAARRCGDHVAVSFMQPGGRPLLKALNGDIQHSCALYDFARLYRLSRRPCDLDFCRFIVRQWEESKTLRLVSDASDWSKLSCHKAAEMLICYQGLVELYRATGDKALLDAAKKYWDSIQRTQIRPTGGGAIGEGWTTGPGDLFLDLTKNPNENCVAVSWMKLTVCLIEETGQAAYADAFERTLYNHLLGQQSADGKDFAYYQPEQGRKIQITNPGLYACCRYRGMNMLAYLPRYIVMRDKSGPRVILYTPSTTRLEAGGIPVVLKQETDFPRSGRVRISVKPEHDVRFTVSLRKPQWCKKFDLSIDGTKTEIPAGADGFIRIERAWKSRGAIVDLNLSMHTEPVHQNIGNRDCVAVVHGPVVLALDTHYGIPIRGVELAAETGQIDLQPIGATSSPSSMAAFRAAGFVEGRARTLTLVDYASAATADLTRDEFAIWLPLRDAVKP